MSRWNVASSRSTEKPVNAPGTSLAANHVHFNVHNPTAYTTASLNTIPAVDVTIYGQSDFFSGQRTINSYNAISTDRPRLKRTTQLNATSIITLCDNNNSL